MGDPASSQAPVLSAFAACPVMQPPYSGQGPGWTDLPPTISAILVHLLPCSWCPCMSLSSSCTQSTGFTHGMACRRGRKVAHGMGEASSTGLQHSRLAASPPLSGAAHPERPSNVAGTADRQHYVKEGASAKRKAAEVPCQCKLSPACSPWSSRTAQSATTWRRGWHTGCAGGHLPADMSSRIEKVLAQSQLMMLCTAPDGAQRTGSAPLQTTAAGLTRPLAWECSRTQLECQKTLRPVLWPLWHATAAALGQEDGRKFQGRCSSHGQLAANAAAGYCDSCH